MRTAPVWQRWADYAVMTWCLIVCWVVGHDCVDRPGCIRWWCRRCRREV